MSNKLNTQTVSELIELLQDLKNQGYGDTPVVCNQPSHDHWRTAIAGEIREASEAKAKYTPYHQQFKLVEESDDRSESDEIVTVIVLE